MISKIAGNVSSSINNKKVSKYSFNSNYTSSKRDELNISDFSSHLAKYNNQLKTISDVRENKVAELKQEIEQENFFSDDKAKTISMSIILSGFLDEI